MTVYEIALALLNQYEVDQKYVNLSLQSHITDVLDKEKRARLTVLLYTTVERKLTYDYYISYLAERGIAEIDLEIKNILRLGLCMLLDMDGIPDFAAVNEAVGLVKQKSSRGFVNGVLRRACREKDRLPLPKPEKNFARYLSVRYSVALPLVRAYIENFGESDAEKLLSAMNTAQGLSISVNTLKISVDEYLKLLSERGISAEKSKFSDISVRLDKSHNPKNLPGYDEGYFFVQDEACAAAVQLLELSVGDIAVDVCAAPGGKSFALAVLSADEAKIHSFDISEAKLPLISEGAKRLGLASVCSLVFDATENRAELVGKCQAVICDVPCSGLGVLAKKPDLRYKDIDTLSELTALQAKIISSASNYLAPGGIMIYSTCTLNPTENIGTVGEFLREHTDFEAVDFKISDESSIGGAFTFLPHKHGTDGFFVAKLRKKQI